MGWGLKEMGTSPIISTFSSPEGHERLPFHSPIMASYFLYSTPREAPGKRASRTWILGVDQLPGMRRRAQRRQHWVQVAGYLYPVFHNSCLYLHASSLFVFHCWCLLALHLNILAYVLCLQDFCFPKGTPTNVGQTASMRYSVNWSWNENKQLLVQLGLTFI